MARELEAFQRQLHAACGPSAAAQAACATKLAHIVTTDLAWVLAGSDAHSIYQDAETLARADNVVTSLQKLFSRERCPNISIRLGEIAEQIQLECDDDAEMKLGVNTVDESSDSDSGGNYPEGWRDTYEWTWLGGFRLSHVEQTYRYYNFIRTSTLLPLLRIVFGFLMVLFHVRYFLDNRKEPEGSNFVFAITTAISLLMFLTILRGTHALQMRLGNKTFDVYPYDGYFWGFLFQMISVMEFCNSPYTILALFTSTCLVHFCHAFTYGFSALGWFGYGLAMFFIGSMKNDYARRQSNGVCAGMIDAWKPVGCVFIAALCAGSYLLMCLERYQRQRFIETNKTKLAKKLM